MLGKLFKYEMKATARNFLPIYAVILVLSIFNNFMIFNRDESLKWLLIISIMLYIALFIALIVITFVVLIQRFYKSVFKEEGYLTHTLPVSSNQIILSKLFSVIVWIFLSIITGFLSMIILTIGHGFIEEALRNLPIIINKFIQESGINLGYFILFIIDPIIKLFTSILLIYTSIAVGHMPKFSKNPIIFSVAAFFTISIIVNTLYSAVIFNFNLPNNHGLLLIVDNLINILLFVVYYIVLNYILNKKLNLE